MYYAKVAGLAVIQPADMAELADAIDLGSIVNRRAGSSPVIRITAVDRVGGAKLHAHPFVLSGGMRYAEFI